MRDNKYIQTVIKKFEKEFPTTEKNSIEAMKWFQRYLRKNLRNMRTSQLMRGNPTSLDIPRLGSFHFFVYDAKTKDKLPFWDAFPLMLCIDIDMVNNSILGLNLHYLSPKLRVRIMAELLELKNNNRYTSNTRLIATYQRLKLISNFPLIGKMVKRYLFSHVRSKFIVVDPEVWGLAINLPVERFQKASNKDVWAS